MIARLSQTKPPGPAFCGPKSAGADLWDLNAEQPVDKSVNHRPWEDSGEEPDQQLQAVERE